MDFSDWPDDLLDRIVETKERERADLQRQADACGRQAAAIRLELARRRGEPLGEDWGS